MADDLDFGATIRGMSPGQKVFGRYTLKRIMGRGGMGVVWLAQDESLEREVAIKLLPEVVANDPIAIKDLKRETAKSQALTHPHILRIYDFNQQAGLCGITMELVEGGTLSARRLEQPGEVFTVGTLRPWVQQLCEALDYAHQRVKIVHRDLKPANLMLDGQGEVKVADFGIAASVSDTVSRASMHASSSGTPVYMSPQQMMGEKPAVTDDIYALGASLYELLTGKPPFYTGNVIVQVHSKVPPTIAERRAEREVTAGGEVPAAWEETIAACLAKDPAARPQSAGEMAKRLGVLTTSQAGRLTPNTEHPISVTAAASAQHSKDTVPGELRKSKAPQLALVAALLGVFGWWLGLLGPERGGPVAESLRLGPEAQARAVRQPWPQPGQSFENSLGMKFVPVSGTGVLFSIWETREQDYEAFVRATNRAWSRVDAGPTHPAVYVSWLHAQAFCGWLTEKERREGRLGPDQSYRLPTDAEWSAAVGLNDEPGDNPWEKNNKVKDHYPWGSNWPPPHRAGNYADESLKRANPGWTIIQGYDDGHPSTAPVGSFMVNANGLYDMGGNVSELVEDEWRSGRTPAGYRVVRGASFQAHSPGHLQSSNRFNHAQDSRSLSGGFRVVLAFGSFPP